MSGYEVVNIADLESFPVDEEGLTWRPIRRRFDIRAFGVNAYTADREGQRVVEEHRETGGHQELYVVIAGRATFTLDGEEHDAPAGTLVHCPPDTLRSAFAAEPGTTVLGIGAKPGEVYQPSGWEWTFAAFALLKQGDLERARAEMEAGIAERPRPGRVTTTSRASRRVAETRTRRCAIWHERQSSSRARWRSWPQVTRTSRRFAATSAS